MRHRHSLSTEGRRATSVLLATALAAAWPGAAAHGQDPLAEDHATGPGGVPVLRSRARIGGSTRLQFKQIAGSNTDGKVINTTQDFDITRLPATFAATLDTGEICTATLIGPRVLLTAAHCIDQNFQVDGVWQTVKGRVARADGSNARQIRSCTMAPAYTASDPQPGTVRNTNDFALCELVADFSGLRAETVSQGPEAVAPGRNLLIAGYGCTNSDLTGGTITAGTPNKGILNVGHNKVGTGRQDAWLSMAGQVGSNDAILCPGDSGGAAYANVDLDDANDVGWRVVAVNSAVGPAPTGGQGAYVSYLAALSDPDFQAFLRSWHATRPASRKVCGVQVSHLTGNCRK